MHLLDSRKHRKLAISRPVNRRVSIVVEKMVTLEDRLTEVEALVENRSDLRSSTEATD